MAQRERLVHPPVPMSQDFADRPRTGRRLYVHSADPQLGVDSRLFESAAQPIHAFDCRTTPMDDGDVEHRFQGSDTEVGSSATLLKDNVAE